MLAWFVNCLWMLAAGMAWTAVFEEVDGIARVEAFGIFRGHSTSASLWLHYMLQQPR